MKITYYKRWFFGKNRGIQELAEKQAEKAHNDGKLYVALISENDAPYCYIELRLEVKHVAVGFFDSYSRVYLSYIFSNRSDDNQVFLAQFFHSIFQNSEDKAALTQEHIIFKTTGRVVITETNMKTNEVIRKRESAESVDLSGNWEPVPEFGHYDSIIRKERPIPDAWNVNKTSVSDDVC